MPPVKWSLDGARKKLRSNASVFIESRINHKLLCSIESYFIKWNIDKNLYLNSYSPTRTHCAGGSPLLSSNSNPLFRPSSLTLSFPTPLLKYSRCLALPLAPNRRHCLEHQTEGWIRGWWHNASVAWTGLLTLLCHCSLKHLELIAVLIFHFNNYFRWNKPLEMFLYPYLPDFLPCF